MRYSQYIDKMTLAEKCGILSGKDVWHTRAVERLGIPSIALADGPSGLRKQAGEGDHLGLNASTKATCFPSAATIANSWDTALAEAVGTAIGREARQQGVGVVLGPGLNTKRSPLCGRNFEYYSEDPYLSGKLAAGFIRGVQAQGVAACPKHFAANSQELRRMANDSVVDERTLRELYLTNFEIAVTEGKPLSIMTAYNLINGIYANENTHLLRDILSGEWGFDGAVVTDWGGSSDFVEGIRAGSHLEMPGAGDDSACQLLRAVQTGEIDEETVNERVDALLHLIFSVSAATPDVPVDVDQAHGVARKAAEESIVLLKNEGSSLPLQQRTRVAIIGDFAETPRYQGAGSSVVNPTRVDNTLDLITRYFPGSTGYTQGFHRDGRWDQALLEQALGLAKESECVLLYLGLPEAYETEGLDRQHMQMPENQIRLLECLAKVNANIIVVLSAGSAVEMPWLLHCKALVYGCLGGQAGADAMLRVVSGAVCPSGKLAESFPVHYEDLPVSRYYPGLERTSEYREGLYVGYRYLETAQIPVCFPFGYGLSYTTFAYSDIAVEEGQVTFDITNTGRMAGAEVAQLYVSLPEAQVYRPRLELKGFAKVQLDAGERRRVSIALDDKAFRYFNPQTGRFEIEGGTYELLIGASARDIRLHGSIAVQGTGAPLPYPMEAVACYREATVHAVSDEAFAALLGHSIPAAKWDTSAPLGLNDTVSQLYYAKNPLARLVCRMLARMKDKSLAAGKPDLNILFIYYIPFRGIAKMMNGMVTMDMARALVRMVNGHFFRGAGALIRGFFSKPRLPASSDTETREGI